MRNTIAWFMVSFLFVAILSACGSVRFKSESPEAATQETAQTASDNANAEELNCDAYMQSFADSCFEVTVLDENGALRNDVDADGNDLGPVDQGWAADYCSCFAQRAFQEFGCAAVYADEELDDAAWQAKYTAIGDACAEAVAYYDDPAAVDGDNFEGGDVIEESYEEPIDASESYSGSF